MKRIFTICIVVTGLFFTACERSFYKEPSAQGKEVIVHNTNNIFNY